MQNNFYGWYFFGLLVAMFGGVPIGGFVTATIVLIVGVLVALLLWATKHAGLLLPVLGGVLMFTFMFVGGFLFIVFMAR